MEGVYCIEETINGNRYNNERLLHFFKKQKKFIALKKIIIRSFSLKKNNGINYVFKK